MEFRILGPLEVVDEGAPVRIERRLERALLAYLLLHANKPVSSDQLIDRLWGETPPRTADASLKNHVSRLRKSIGAERLPLEAAGYVLRVDPEHFDLGRFDRLVAEAHSAAAKERAELLRAALSLWRGQPLEDLAFEEFAQAEIAHLNERLIGATEARIDADLELGRSADLVDELDALISAYPLRERLRSHLMLALYRTGRQADALEAYREARRVLHDELGLEPGEGLRDLHRRILEQDSSLLPRGELVEVGESRRMVTVLFCEVVESARLVTELDPEAYRILMSAYYDAAGRAIEAHGGTVDTFAGNAITALFGVPELHEDDALRAVRAAIDLRTAIARLRAERELRIRIAIETGEVVTSSAHHRAPRTVGAPVNVAASLGQRAGPNDIVLGKETERLVRNAVRAVSSKLDDGSIAWHLKALIAQMPQIARVPETPLVGRETELRRLRAAFQRARKESSCGVVTVVGEAGIGKTRLARELLLSLRDDAHVLVGRCVSYGAGATYLPFAEIVRKLAPERSVRGIATLLGEGGDSRRIAHRIAELVGIAEGPAAPGEAFLALRRLLEALADEQPVVLVLDDLHWAEPTLLDLVEYLGGWAQGPIFVLGLARRDLLESRPGWGGPTSAGFVVELAPLAADEIEALLEQRTSATIRPLLRDQIVERAAGNPLFAEQLLAHADEAPDAALERAPPTVEALIGARLDRLGRHELELLRRAAVIGRIFMIEELQDLGDLAESELAAVVRKGFLQPLHVDPGYRFRHVLVRDVVYHGMPKAQRAELHEQVADSLDRRDGTDELVGYHLEQAHRYRVELRRADDRARRLAQAAGERLGRAGIRAWKRADAPATVKLLSRAVDLLPDSDASRRELLCELGAAARGGGELDRAQQAFSEALETAGQHGDRRIELRARIELSNLRAFADAREVDGLVELASRAIPQLETFGDTRSLGRVWLSLGLMRGSFHGENAALEEAATRAAEYYRQGGWSPSTCLGAVGSALYYGPRPVSEAIEQCEHLLETYAGDGASEANIAVWLGGLQAMRGSFDLARELVERARTVYEDLGQVLAEGATCGLVLGAVELLAGRLEEGEHALRQSCETCRQLNEYAWLASRSAELADVLCDQSRLDEASEWASLSESLAGPDDRDAQSSWRTVRARILARSNEFDRARQLAGEAVAISDRTDALNQRARALLNLAEVTGMAGFEEPASKALMSALRLYERKGNVVAAARTREREEARTAAS